MLCVKHLFLNQKEETSYKTLPEKRAGSSKKIDASTKVDSVKPTSEVTSSDQRQDEENKEKLQDSQIDIKHRTPSQMASEKRISELEKNLNVLYAAKDSMPGIQIQKQINKLSDDLKKEKQSLKRKRQNAETEPPNEQNLKKSAMIIQTLKEN
ncbi:hypothetical protein AVEN_34051-1 [Araneus ventricosus]|uniref:Uncharacterized protein n=1 Tax=Araneus ventricosus TaxID=182803 RepID=A0A4Y2EZH4_ARAVE|nr:hypothetical protein AVEN_34051-1 [Araneus ventricosus]